MCFEDKKEEFNNYGFTVNREKQRRYELLKDFYREAREIKSILDRFNGIDRKSINFDDLDKFDLNLSYQLNDKVVIKKTYSSEDRLIFDTLMVKGGEFGWHVHGDCNEKVEVIEGALLENNSNILYTSGEILYILAEQDHTPISLEDTILKVTFFKNKK